MDKILSIIVPSYNMEAYLPKCLGSLVFDDKELLQKLDVIVVNDGSKDRTSEIAHEFEAKYPGIFRVIDKENGHYGSCLNAALPLMKGAYVKVLDADDYFDSQVFKRYLVFLGNLLASASAPDLVLSEFVIEHPDGASVFKSAPLHNEGQVLDIEEFVDCSYCLHYGMTFKSRLFGILNYRQTEGVCYTDTEMTMYPLAACRDFTCFPWALYHYLVGREGQSVSSAQMAKNLWMLEKVALGLVAGLPKALKDATEAHRRFVLKNAWNVFVNLYKTSICGSGRGLYDSQLRALDEKVQVEYPELYEYLADACTYSPLAPYKFVPDWRANSKLLGIRLFWARVRNAVASRLGTLRGR